MFRRAGLSSQAAQLATHVGVISSARPVQLIFTDLGVEPASRRDTAMVAVSAQRRNTNQRQHATHPAVLHARYIVSANGRRGNKGVCINPGDQRGQWRAGSSGLMQACVDSSVLVEAHSGAAGQGHMNEMHAAREAGLRGVHPPYGGGRCGRGAGGSWINGGPARGHTTYWARRAVQSV